jgi:hypothetical protein
MRKMQPGDLVHYIPPPMVGVLGCMAERLKTKLLESDKMVSFMLFLLLTRASSYLRVAPSGRLRRRSRCIQRYSSVLLFKVPSFSPFPNLCDVRMLAAVDGCEEKEDDLKIESYFHLNKVVL